MSQPNPNSQAPMVLIVDDDAESLLLVSTMVEYVGYRPMTASTFAEARALLDQQPTALVLDLVMPDQTAERILTLLHETGSKLPVVLISASLRDQLSIQALEQARRGINVVSTLAKPFWVDVLVTALEQAMPELPADAIAN
jgi:CheY-like chemotaxis protein